MNLSIKLTQNTLKEFLLNVAIVRPVFIWGAPGIGKSSLVEQFAAEVGKGLSDILGEGDVRFYKAPVGLDDFYRRAISEGLEYHKAGRGLVPAGLEEEIQALYRDPIPWDVELARWFDSFFAPIEKKRTYARASRRQSSTPDIVRPERYRIATCWKTVPSAWSSIPLAPWTATCWRWRWDR